MENVQNISITEAAAQRVSELISTESYGNHMLRVSISAGGCSGFEYSFKLDKLRDENDRVFEKLGISIVVDNVSLEMLDGAEVDYVDDLSGAAFRLKIPNATASCGCGISFSV